MRVPAIAPRTKETAPCTRSIAIAPARAQSLTELACIHPTCLRRMHASSCRQRHAEHTHTHTHACRPRHRAWQNNTLTPFLEAELPGAHGRMSLPPLLPRPCTRSGARCGIELRPRWCSSQLPLRPRASSPTELADLCDGRLCLARGETRIFGGAARQHTAILELRNRSELRLWDHGNYELTKKLLDPTIPHALLRRAMLELPEHLKMRRLTLPLGRRDSFVVDVAEKGRAAWQLSTHGRPALHGSGRAALPDFGSPVPPHGGWR